MNSTFFTVLYVAISIPVVAMGAAADRFGLVRAGVLVAIAVAALALSALWLLGHERGRTRQRERQPESQRQPQR